MFFKVAFLVIAIVALSASNRDATMKSFYDDLVQKESERVLTNEDIRKQFVEYLRTKSFNLDTLIADWAKLPGDCNRILGSTMLEAAFRILSKNMKNFVANDKKFRMGDNTNIAIYLRKLDDNLDGLILTLQNDPNSFFNIGNVYKNENNAIYQFLVNKQNIVRNTLQAQFTPQSLSDYMTESTKNYVQFQQNIAASENNGQNNNNNNGGVQKPCRGIINVLGICIDIFG